MRRRDFIIVVGSTAATWPLAAPAQNARVYRIGVLTLATPDPEPLLDAFREGLHEAGYIEGRNLRLEIRSAAGSADLQLEKAVELVGLKVDLIVTFFTPPALAAKQATQKIPIVMAGAGDPVASGLVASLAHPGGNVTGQSSGGAELAGKSVELIRELIPTTRRQAAWFLAMSAVNLSATSRFCRFGLARNALVMSSRKSAPASC